MLITKPHIDPTNNYNFRPIPLMNIGVKVLNMILTNWIQEHIKMTIHHDQVGFIPGLQEWFNIWNSMNVIHHINNLKGKKKPTWSSHQMLKKNPLTKLNLSSNQKPGKIRDARNMLIHNKVNLQQACSCHKIPLKSGKRQSCPYILTIVLKILSRAIKQMNKIRGIQLKRKRSKYHYLQMIW